MLKKTYLIIAACVFVLLPSFVFAQTNTDITATCGILNSPDYQGSDDYSTNPLIVVEITSDSGRYISTSGYETKANLIGSQRFWFGPVINYLPERNDSLYDRYVKKLRPVKSTVEAGAFAGIHLGVWQMSAHYMMDTGDSHEGKKVSVDTSVILPFSEKGYVTIGAMTTCADKNYMKTFYSVDQNNSIRSGLPRFEADAGFLAYGANTSLTWQFYKNWHIYGELKYKRMAGDAKKSPLVAQRGETGQLTSVLSLGYTF